MTWSMSLTGSDWMPFMRWPYPSLRMVTVSSTRADPRPVRRLLFGSYVQSRRLPTRLLLPPLQGSFRTPRRWTVADAFQAGAPVVDRPCEYPTPFQYDEIVRRSRHDGPRFEQIPR
jgi:hypothetical protein